MNPSLSLSARRKSLLQTSSLSVAIAIAFICFLFGRHCHHFYLLLLFTLIAFLYLPLLPLPSLFLTEVSLFLNSHRSSHHSYSLCYSMMGPSCLNVVFFFTFLFPTPPLNQSIGVPFFSFSFWTFFLFFSVVNEKCHFSLKIFQHLCFTLFQAQDQYIMHIIFQLMNVLLFSVIIILTQSNSTTGHFHSVPSDI